jgi:hypothetical protein
VLVVDLHALQTVDVLHLVDDVARQFLDAQQAQDVLRVGRPSTITRPVDHLAFVHQDVLLLGHQLFVTLPSGSVICRRTLPLVSLPKDTVPVISASSPCPSGCALRTARPPAADRR